MKSNVEILEPTKIKLSVDADYDDIKPSVDRAYQEISEQINVPGFRKGKVPQAIINQRIGWGPVIDQAVNDALPGLYAKVAEEQQLRPLARPEIEVTAVPEKPGEGQLSFTATVTVRPKIELPDLDTIEVEVPTIEVTDDEIDEQLDHLRERYGTLSEIDRPASNDDFVTIDLSAKIGDEEVDTVSGVSYQLGGDNMLPGLDEALDGMSEGETTTFRTQLAGGEHAGEDADVTVTVTGVKERELPEADDEFAQTASEFDTIGDLKDDIRAHLTRNAAAQQAIAARTALVDKLLETTEVPIPADVLNARVDAHLEAEERTDDDAHRDEVINETRSELREQLLMDTLAEKVDVKVSQEEVLQFLIQAAGQWGMDPQEFIRAISEGGSMPHMIGEVARAKGAAMALRKIPVKDETGAVVDLTPFIGSDELDAAQAAAQAEYLAQQAADQVATAGYTADSEGGQEEYLAPTSSDPTAIPEF